MQIINRLQAHLGLSVYFWHDDMSYEREIESIECHPDLNIWHGRIGYGVDEQFFVCGDLNEEGQAVMTGLRVAALNTETSDITVELNDISFLTNDEKDYFIKEAGHPVEDLAQLGRAIQDVNVYYCKDKDSEVSITRIDAERMLGYHEFLSGVSRAAFHETAWRTPENRTDGEGIHFSLRHWWHNS